MSDSRTEPSPFRPQAAGSLPVRPLTLWALLIPLAHAPALLIGEGFDARIFLGVAGASAVAFLAVRLLAGGRRLDRFAARMEGASPALLALACALFAAITFARSAGGLARFEEYAIAGLFSQSFWTLFHGHPFSNSQESVNGTLASHFGVHFSPTLLVLAPFYALWPGPRTLMAGQAVALALAPVPLYALLRPRVGGAAALMLALTLLALPIFLRAGGRDFHDACFLPAPFLAAVWALEARRPVWLAVFVLAVLGVREDAGLAVAMFGLYALARGHGVKTAVALAALGLGWFALATRVIIPAFGSPGIIADPRRFFEAAFGHWGATPTAAVRGILSDPVRVLRWFATREIAQYAYSLALPLLLLPPFLDAALLMALPGLAINLLSRYAFMHSAAEPYSYVPLAFLTLAATSLAVRVAARAPDDRRLGAGFAAGIIVLAGAFPAALAPNLMLERAQLPPAVAHEVVRLIPGDAPVYAAIALYPAMCNRETFDCWWNTGGVERNAGFRSRYAWIVLWPAADPAGDPRDRAMAESLAADPGFARLEGFAPLVVYQRR
ncbi:MAG: DUF2079 domain-containing protein [Candidatus Eisenbacteria bacterium]